MIDYIQALSDFADECIRCGVCAQCDCGNYPEGAPTLGDMAESIVSGDETWFHFPFTCALCNRCTVECPMDLKANAACKPARAYLLKNHPEMRGNYRHFRTDLRHNLFSLLQGQSNGGFENFEVLQGQATGNEHADATAFFPGCSLGTYGKELSEKVMGWLVDEGIASWQINVCCGATFYDTGFYDEFKEYRKGFQAFIAEKGIKRLIICCPHCNHILPDLLEGTDVELIKMPELLLEHGKTIDFEGSYCMHDACYDREDLAFGTAARELMGGTEIKMEHTGRETICCGGGGMVSAYAPAYCEYRRNMRLAEMGSVSPDVLISTCFSCVNSLQRGAAATPMKHYLEFAFDHEMDWSQVYSSVDRMYAHPQTNDLLAGEAPMFPAHPEA